ncbi:double zinc ribbon domain-containing protein [Tateyamaria armeniaca]|uniref:Double zinc ribbon domain-containing protein n=1 Tax=Tateyamaria armeniaca TaxID=2518930 RepID=A0ABW8UQX6_9RHOB
MGARGKERHGPLTNYVGCDLPPRCLGCGETVDSDFGLCGTCWGQTQFIGGAACDSCGTPCPAT